MLTLPGRPQKRGGLLGTGVRVCVCVCVGGGGGGGGGGGWRVESEWLDRALDRKNEGLIAGANPEDQRCRGPP